MGITISLAGKPNINEINTTPSNPINLPNGSSSILKLDNILVSLIFMLAKSQISNPVGNATITALPNTCSVLLNILLIIVFINWGLRYGGNSKVNDEGVPLSIVFDNNQDVNKVTIIPSNITPVSINPFNKLELLLPIKNIDMMANRVGNLPLQGIKLLVKMAISLSRLESIIRQPVTPTALHPKPIHIVKACLPHALHFWKQRSRLKAIRGKYPKSSNIENKGKNIAIGGSITEVTQAKVL